MLLSKYQQFLPSSVLEDYAQYGRELDQAKQNTEQIFYYYAKGKIALAASYMAKMDQDFARSVSELKKISAKIINIQG